MTPPLKSTCVGRRGRRTAPDRPTSRRPPPRCAQEPRQVPRDGRVGGVRQAELLQADAPLARRHRIARARRGKKPSTSTLFTIVRASASVLIVPPISLRAAAEHRHRRCGAGTVAEAALPSPAAPGATARAAARRRACGPAAASRCCSSAGEREVHVVAAEQDVVADGHALEREVAVALRDTAIRVKSVVPPPTSHTRIEVADARRAGASASPLRVEPGVERGLRLLEQRDVLEARRPSAARTVSSRATASNDAGTVSSTSCVVASGVAVRDLAGSRRRAGGAGTRPRRRPARSCGTSAGAPHGRIGAAAVRRRRTTATTSPTRPAAPGSRRRACARTRRRRLLDRRSHGSARLPAGKSTSPGRYRNEGSSERAATSRGFTSCGTSRTSIEALGPRPDLRSARRARSWWCRDRSRR